MINYHNISTLYVDDIFDSYLLTTNKSGDDPEILLEISLDQLLSALKSMVDCADVSFRLRNNGGSCVISLTASLSVEGGRVDMSHMIDPDDELGHDASDDAVRGSECKRVLVHEVPILVIGGDSIRDCEPKFTDPSVHLKLPEAKHVEFISNAYTRLELLARASASEFSGLKHSKINNDGELDSVIAAIKPGARPRLEIAATLQNQFRVRAISDTGSFETVWPCMHPDVREGFSTDSIEAFRAAGPDKWASVLVDAADWLHVLDVSRLTSELIVSIADKRGLVVHAYVDGYTPDVQSSLTVSSFFIMGYPLHLLRTLLTVRLVLRPDVQSMNDRMIEMTV